MKSSEINLCSMVK